MERYRFFCSSSSRVRGKKPGKERLHYSNHVDECFRCEPCCCQDLNELAQGTIPHFRHYLVAKVPENPSIQAMLPAIDRDRFQRPPSTRRERLHPPLGPLHRPAQYTCPRNLDC